MCWGSSDIYHTHQILHLLFCVFAIGPAQPVLFIGVLFVHYITSLQCRQQNPCLPGSHKLSWAQSRPEQCKIHIRNAILPTCCFSTGSSVVVIPLCEHSHNTEHPKTWLSSDSVMYSLTNNIDKGNAWMSFLTLVLSCCRGVSIVVPFCQVHGLFP